MMYQPTTTSKVLGSGSTDNSRVSLYAVPEFGRTYVVKAIVVNLEKESEATGKILLKNGESFVPIAPGPVLKPKEEIELTIGVDLSEPAELFVESELKISVTLFGVETVFKGPKYDS